MFATPEIPPGGKAVYYKCWAVFDVINGRPEGLERMLPEIRVTATRPPTIDPREAARRVVETMDFVAPRLGLSPYLQSATREAVVNVPVWMWVADPGASTTGPQTKTAAVGGVSITATATVDRIEWSMGDAKVVTCKGAGTPFNIASVKGRALRDVPASPTCGHKYAKASRCEKSGAFKVTATTFWNVHWTGGGTQGDIPLQFSRSTDLRVIDLKPVLIDPNASQVQAPTTSTCS